MTNPHTRVGLGLGVGGFVGLGLGVGSGVGVGGFVGGFVGVGVGSGVGVGVGVGVGWWVWVCIRHRWHAFGGCGDARVRPTTSHKAAGMLGLG